MARRAESAAPAAPETDEHLPAGKGRATPSRAEREAARKRPLVPADRKAAAKDARAKNAEARERARLGMAAGDERYLTQRDRGPQRRFVREYVDARFTVAEFLMPVMLVIIVFTFVPVPALQYYGIIVLWAFFALAIIDSAIMVFTMKRRLRAKFGELERGLTWYAVMRALQFRMIRIPKPQNKRGQYPA
ncbi:MAG TPA: DUF3043 domain-containing protein [Vicinamibacterales bacterium]|uniref:DUF3043 domain-containing protein n=1 Tax=Humibacter sp. TaxID=1940291 RepID=UPI002BF024C2|nr:DUF3043 domain-containing protein [Humibacter sp.]HVX08648.1 DUF3043 domain-containing protein [Humibacter sp.]HVZ24108.1 DUF3043 domain-containing protein [Vicinamibacterales bacterium]